MEKNIQMSRKESIPIILTVVLILATFLVIVANMMIPTEPFSTIGLWLLILIDLAFIVTMIMGIKTKRTAIVFFSIIANGLCFVLLTGVLLLIGFAMGFGEV